MPAKLLPAPTFATRLYPGEGRYIKIDGLERGMIFWKCVEPDDVIEGEHHHAPKPCPWVVISRDAIHGRLPIVQVAPLSSGEGALHEGFRQYRIRIPHEFFEHYEGSQPRLDDRERVIKPEQARVWAHKRLENETPVAKLNAKGFAGIRAGISYVFGL